MIVQRPFQCWDVQFVDASIPEDVSKFRQQIGRSMTLLDSGKVFACGGIDPVHKNVCQLWMAHNCMTLHQKIAMLKYARLMIAKAKVGHDRIQAIADVEDARLPRWFERLGFKKETPPLKRYLPNGHGGVIFGIVTNG